jgi:hypothetical protein
MRVDNQLMLGSCNQQHKQVTTRHVVDAIANRGDIASNPDTCRDSQTQAGHSPGSGGGGRGAPAINTAA